LLEHDTAGDPMTGLRWSRRTTTRISEELRQLGICVCPNTVARLLDQMGYSLRVNHKQISTNSSPDRNLQFEYLAELRRQFQRRHLPIISVDTKKRGLVGNFKNAGRRWEHCPRRVFDHDFRTDSIGVAIPYGIYDITGNRGAFVVGISHDTPAFAAHALPTGGSRKVPSAIPAPTGFSFWPIPAAATAIVVMPGKPSFSPNWPTPSPWPSLSPTIQLALPNGTPSNIVSSLRSRGTGLVNR
jgi:hypothetical protein